MQRSRVSQVARINVGECPYGDLALCRSAGRVGRVDHLKSRAPTVNDQVRIPIDEHPCTADTLQLVRRRTVVSCSCNSGVDVTRQSTPKSGTTAAVPPCVMCYFTYRRSCVPRVSVAYHVNTLLILAGARYTG